MTIEPYSDAVRSEVISVWERSVRATHTFLKRDDIAFYKSIVETIDFNQLSVYCAKASDGELIGFIGVAEGKIEMLFLHPSYIGQGNGKALIEFAIDKLGATSVDVNEGNRYAVGFYQSFGFEVYDRMEKDSEGKEYPILKMRR
jgi:putative acetyltransferase